jgi:hypothetical protein
VPLAEAEGLLREPATLFFIHDCSHQGIAVFLGLSVATVNDRQHAARSKPKERMLVMVNETFHADVLPDYFANRIGRPIEARGAVVEGAVQSGRPARCSDRACGERRGQLPRRIAVQVIQSPTGGIALGIALSPADAVQSGSTVLSSENQSETPVNLDELRDSDDDSVWLSVARGVHRVFNASEGLRAPLRCEPCEAMYIPIGYTGNAS